MKIRMMLALGAVGFAYGALAAEENRALPKKEHFVPALAQDTGKVAADAELKDNGNGWTGYAPWKIKGDCYPVTNQDYVVRYPDRVRKMPVLKGVQIPADKCTDANLDELAGWGATLIRRQCRWHAMKKSLKGGWEDPDLETRYFDWIRTEAADVRDAAARAAQRGIRITFSLPPPGGNFSSKDKGHNGAEGKFLFEPRFANLWVRGWKLYASLVKDIPNVYGYDLVNEPHHASPAAKDCDYWNVQRRAAEAIRSVDPDTTIIMTCAIGGNPPGYDFMSPLAMDNVIYTVHVYLPHKFSHQGLGSQHVAPPLEQRVKYPSDVVDAAFQRKCLERVRAFQLKHRARIFVGEFSAVVWAPGGADYIREYLKLFKEWGWDWTYHAYKENPLWSIEHAYDETLRKIVPSTDNPRRRVLLEALASKDGGASAIPRETLAFNLDFWRFFYISAPGAADDPGIRASAEDSDGAYSQVKRGYTPDEAGCLAYVDDILRGGVTRFISNINAQRCNVDSKVLEPVWVNGEGGANPQYDQLVARSARLLHERGVNPHKVWFRRCREKNVEPWLSFRMNDMHGSDCPGSAAVSDFWREHPEYRRYPEGMPTNVWSWAAQSLDYAHEPVRRRMLAFIRECLENYDVDGIELDYTRFVWYFRPGREREDARFLMEFQREVRRMTDDAAKRTGHPVRISLRLLACPETEEALGLDVGAWAQEGLMDIVDVGCHFCSNDFEIPLAAWRKLVGDRVEVLPHCDNGHSIYTPDWFRRRMNLEEYAGFADTAYARGARGLSLFNLFGHPVDSPEWNEILVKGLGPNRIAEMPRRYPLSYRDMEFTEGAARAYPQLLPAALTNGFRCSIFLGTLPAKGTASLIVGLAGDGKGALPQARVNGVSLPAFTPREEPRCRGYESAVPLDALRAGRNEIVLDPAVGARLAYVALRVDPQ